MTTRPMTAQEHEQGWYVCCPCGRHAYVFKAAVLEQPGFRAEACPEAPDMGPLMVVDAAP